MDTEPESQPAVTLSPMARSNLTDSMVVVVLFIGLNRFAGLGWAIGAATLWSLKATVTRWRSGAPIGKFLPLVTVAILGRGLIGILTDSEAVYFGLGIAAKAGVGVVLIGSALIGRNLVARYAPYLFGFDAQTVVHPAYKRAMLWVAWAAGLAELASAAFDVWLFNNSSTNGYVLIRFLVNWPFATLVILGCMAYLARALRQVPGFPGLGVLLERQMAAYEEAFRARKRPEPVD